MSDEVAKLRRRVRQLERSRQGWKGRCADKQSHIRYLRVKARDLAKSRDRWRSLAAADGPAGADSGTAGEAAVLLPLPAPLGGACLGEA